MLSASHPKCPNRIMVLINIHGIIKSIPIEEFDTPRECSCDVFECSQRKCI